ncbi:MAG TPA: alpha/beta hydrolase [Haliangiales bacterium]|nr:alpha/beta hydrolase [Haliangiales bacterium]
MREDFERWRQEGRTFQHEGHAIFHRTEGEGPALLAIHGFPSASWDWHPMWPELVARFRVVAPDMIGFGWSDKPRRYAYSIMDQATLHEELLAELGIDRVHILAHDYGDSVAQELAARHEDRAGTGEKGPIIESICFLNGGLFPEAHRPTKVQRILAGPFGWIAERLISRGGFGQGLADVFGPRTPPSPELVDELWTLLRHNDGHLVVHRIIGYIAERRAQRERWVGVLQKTKVPLRVIDGAVDPVSGAHMVARYRELIPHPDAVELPNIGHYPQIEDPGAVLEAFLAFHKRLPGRG